jgi:hypothetical protein
MKTTIIKYARKCDITGEGMNEGYCIQDGLMYIKYEKDMLQHILDKTDYDSIEDAYEDDYYYFTDWFDTIEEEDEWYTEDGSLITNIKEGVFLDDIAQQMFSMDYDELSPLDQELIRYEADK